MRNFFRKSAAFVLGPLILLMTWTPSQAQNRSLRGASSPRPPMVVPTRSSGANSVFFRNHFVNRFNRRAAFSPFRHEFFRHHEGREELRTLGILSGLGLFNGGYSATPYLGGYGSPGYSMPYMMGGYTPSYGGYPSSYGGYPSSGYGMQSSYPNYGDSSSYSMPYYAGSTGASTQTANAYANYDNKTNDNKTNDNKTNDNKTNTEAKSVLSSRETGKILNAIGVPNVDGQLTYPLGLKVLQPQTENLQLLDQIETLFQLMAIQEVGGQANPNLAQEAKVAMDRLETLLRDRRVNMMPNVYDAARQYLDKLRHGLQVLQPKTASGS